jgi:hypothetical protein
MQAFGKAERPGDERRHALSSRLCSSGALLSSGLKTREAPPPWETAAAAFDALQAVRVRGRWLEHRVVILPIRR